MQDKPHRGEIITAQNILKLTFFAFACGLIFVLGQSTRLTLAYFTTFSYADFVSYSVFGLILALILWLAIGLVSICFYFPIAQFRKMRELAHAKAWCELLFQFLALLLPFWFIPIAFGFPSFQFEATIPNVITWLIFGLHLILVLLLRIWKKYEPTYMDNVVGNAFDKFGDFGKTVPGVLFLIMGLYVSGIVHVELSSIEGRLIKLKLQDGGTFDSRLISSNSKSVVVSVQDKYIILSRDKITSIEFYADVASEDLP